MPSNGYHDRLWQAIPTASSSPPEGLALRRAFLLDELRGIAAAPGTAAGAGIAATAGAGAGAGAAAASGAGAALRVLDVGCGEAQVSAELASAGFAVVGIDVAEEPLRRARSRGPSLELLRVEPDGEWPLADASFDVVWAGEVIEHVADTLFWLSEVRRVLRSGGSFLLTTPAHDPLTRLLLGLWRPAFERRFYPRSDHLRFYTRGALSRLLEELGFERVLVRGAGGLPGARHTLLARGIRGRFF